MFKKVISTAIFGLSFFAFHHSAMAEEVTFDSVKKSIAYESGKASHAINSAYAKSDLRKGVDAVHRITTNTTNTFTREVQKSYNGSSLQKGIKNINKSVDDTYYESGFYPLTEKAKRFTQSLF